MKPMPAGRDYGIQGPDWTPVDPRIMSASANIRCTLLNDWIVVRGRIVLGRNRVGMEEYRNLCQTLITRPEFRGADFSPGDRYISDCAAGSVSPGTPGVWRRHPPAVFKMESTRPPGFPGNPPARMPRAPTPGEVAASTASETRRDDLPSNARRRPSHSMHFGAQSRGLRAPCERFAPWVTPGPRITRFRLAADLGRMGLVTHRVSNKVSKITSRHLVPLDRAFPAHALVHESKLARHGPTHRCFIDRRRRKLGGPCRSSHSAYCTRAALRPFSHRVSWLEDHRR